MTSHLRRHTAMRCEHCRQADIDLETARSTIATMDHDIAELNEALNAKHIECVGLQGDIEALERQIAELETMRRNYLQERAAP